MNLFANVSNRKGRAIVGAMLCLLLSVLTVAAQAGPNPNANRFLFIIDTSVAMKPMEKKLHETLFDIIYSGARGRMTNGDTYGIWLVNGTNDTSFPMETRKKQHALEGAAKAASHLKGHGLKGKLHLEVAMADVQNVIKNVGDLTVILVTDGSTPIMGTPFDEAINERWKTVAPGFKRAKATLNTALVAQDGAFVAWAVNSPEFLIEIPYVAPKPKPAKVEVAVTKTNTPSPATNTPASAALSSVAAPKPRVSTTPIIITKETVAQEKRSYYSSTPPVEPEPLTAVPTNAVAEIAVTNTANTVDAVSTNDLRSATTNTLAAVCSTNSTAISAKPTISIEQANLEAVALVPAQSGAPEPAAPNQATSLRTALFWAGIGAGAMFVCFVGVIFFLRRNRHEPSLVSQALVRERFTLY